jgi:hypothetical protein
MTKYIPLLLFLFFGEAVAEYRPLPRDMPPANAFGYGSSKLVEEIDPAARSMPSIRAFRAFASKAKDAVLNRDGSGNVCGAATSVSVRYMVSPDNIVYSRFFFGGFGSFMATRATSTQHEIWVDYQMRHKQFEYFPSEQAFKAAYPTLCAVLEKYWANADAEREQRRRQKQAQEASKPWWQRSIE